VEQLERLKQELARGVQPAAAHRLLAEGTRSGEPLPRVRRRLILLAERDPHAGEPAAALLRREGYEVVLVLDAAAAERAAVEHRPDLAIVEITISGGAGVELCASLKKHGALACLAISGLRAGDRDRQGSAAAPRAAARG
jgi:CheY-like chemotaxis protein